jgi:hypothetical protein
LAFKVKILCLDVSRLNVLKIIVDFLEFICYNVGTTNGKEMIHMKTTTFSVTNLTDTDISRLLAECQRELERREERRTAERQRWIDGYYYAFISHPNASLTQVGDVIVVAVYSKTKGLVMGTARPVHGDTFDMVAGTAVAYAKAIGVPVPDYI